MSHLILLHICCTKIVFPSKLHTKMYTPNLTLDCAEVIEVGDTKFMSSNVTFLVINYAKFYGDWEALPIQPIPHPN